MKVGVSMRSDYINTHEEYRAGIDLRWFEYLKKFNVIPVLIPNDVQSAEKVLKSIPVDRFILTGGGDVITPEHVGDVVRGQVEKLILEFSALNKTPLLGVCRGAQAIANYFELSFDFVSGHAGVEHQIIVEANPSNVHRVNSFHKMVITKQDLSEFPIHVLARDMMGNIEAFCVETLPWIAVMWHPERSFSDIDEKIVEPFFRPCSSQKV